MDRNSIGSASFRVCIVALRKESVDRNLKRLKIMKNRRKSLSARRAWIEIPAGCWRDSRRAVALRKESVDRNWRNRRNKKLLLTVALRKESVDRNTNFHPASLFDLSSLSARRAWIEMALGLSWCIRFCVALRKESVDRNLWWGVRKAVGSLVALRKESVDRNFDLAVVDPPYFSRSPQGERG